jgi:hypothetical protein
MSDLHDLQARAGDLKRAIAESDDQHGSLLSGLESGLNQLRERLVGATAANDRLVRQNTELRAMIEQLLSTLENKPSESLHDKLAALDGQLHGLLELPGVPAPIDGSPVTASDEDGASPKSGPKSDSGSGGGPFEEIRDRMRALSSQLLDPASHAVAAEAQGSAPDPVPGPTPFPVVDAPAKSTLESYDRRDSDTLGAFDRPIRALAEKAQSVLPKVRLRFDAETDYALTILRRLRGARQPFGIEEVRELINGKFGLTLTDRDDAQLSASLANQDGVIHGPRSGNANGAQSWRFESG